MYPEKKIVNIWLQNNGFYVVNNINAGRRVIDTIAIKTNNKGIEEVRHIELSCSVTKQPETKRAVQEKFTNPSVKKELRAYLKANLKHVPDYKRVLVATADYSLPGIEVISFKDVLAEVMQQLDKGNYSDPTTRTLQLTKYMLLASPNNLSDVIMQPEGNRALNLAERKRFLKRLLAQKETQEILGRKEFEKSLVKLVAKSSLSRAESMAKHLHESILKKRSKRKFLNIFLKHKDVKRLLPSSKQKALHDYMKKG